MTVLHIINKSPFCSDAVRSCLHTTQPGSGIILIEDGVYASQQGHPLATSLDAIIAEVAVCALLPDRLARGLDEARLIDGIALVDYAGFVALAVKYDKTLSWF